jgi:hypothetical protein
MDNKIDSQVKDSGIKVAGIQTAPAEKVVYRREISPKAIADDISSRIMGKLIGVPDLFDPKTCRFLSEDELRARGAVFMTVSFNKILKVPGDMVVKGRTTKNPTPFVRKVSKYQVIANVNWQEYIRSRGNENFEENKERANGVKNHEGCKGVGALNEKYYVNGVAFKVLESTRYLDENGVEYPDQDFIKSEYLKNQSDESKQKEADKHGIDVRFDPQYRTTRIDSCDSIRVFGFEYVPTI